ncbi:MAG TPA: polyprenyl synthetase family protein [Candidatus Nanopelagicaceae bacterium]|nr:polyprenyl synthetase family protein [Candidatus Nanopelagicaceae bacterium]
MSTPESVTSFTQSRSEIEHSLSIFLQDQRAQLAAIGTELDSVSTSLTEYVLNGGKRLRPLFAYWGFVGAGGIPNSAIIRACASLELIQACALIHDDVMDGSDTRRGFPAIHKKFASLHRDQGLSGDSDAFGISSAILLGDLALVWADKMFHASGVESDALIRSLPVFDEMRVEIMAGQYLDVLEQALASQSVERSLRVAQLKSAKYTVERPLHFGATLAGADQQLLESYSRYGMPLGESFQLRDDLLGVFGNPDETGKPAGDDLREGKRTVLIAATLERANGTQAAFIEQHLGRITLGVNDVMRMREIIIDTGAVAFVEQMIEDGLAKALSALEESQIERNASEHLAELALVAARRSL